MEAHLKAMEALDKINERHMACVRNDLKMKEAHQKPSEIFLQVINIDTDNSPVKAQSAFKVRQLSHRQENTTQRLLTDEEEKEQELKRRYKFDAQSDHQRAKLLSTSPHALYDRYRSMKRYVPTLSEIDCRWKV